MSGGTTEVNDQRKGGHRRSAREFDRERKVSPTAAANPSCKIHHLHTVCITGSALTRRRRHQLCRRCRGQPQRRPTPRPSPPPPPPPAPRTPAGGAQRLPWQDRPSRSERSRLPSRQQCPLPERFPVSYLIYIQEGVFPLCKLLVCRI
jgi:hypothetical protein